MKKRTAELILQDPEKFAHHDRVFLNNPVVMQGMGLAPLVVVATTGQNSLMPRLQGVRDELHTGAMLFCAVFLLNEPYTCAHHRLGRILYGALVGIATMGFRYFGVYETGVCFALLAVNSVSALIDRTEERLYRLLHRLPSERKEAAE